MQDFLDPLQLALSCVTDMVLNVRGGYYPAADPHLLTLGDGGPVRLSGQPRVALAAIQHYRIVEVPDPRGPWRVTTVAYYYAISDDAGPEILAYHWHPNQRSTVTSPHLHLSVGARVGWREMAAAHPPTGPVALDDVLQLAIETFGVEARRSDWRAILDRTRAANAPP